MPVAFVLDRRSGLPLQRQLYEQWRGGILSGRFARGERVPSSRALAETYGVSRTTVAAAYDQLTAEGYFETRRGSGTFVCPELPDAPVRPARRLVSSQTRELPVRLSRFGARLEADTRPPLSPPARGRRPVIDLSNARPDFSHFPLTLWRRLLTRPLRGAGRDRERRHGAGGESVLDYGAGAAGDASLRAAIAAYLGRSRAVRCTPDQIVIVNGSQQALDLCARLLLDDGDHVGVEDPGYQGARELFAAYGARIHALPVQADGVSVGEAPATIRLVHVTPSHQFPTGVSMSLARRLELLDWARRHAVVVLEDDYDSEYRYSGPPLPALQGLADGASIVYLGTFSNVMFPGLRVGYVVVPTALVGAFIAAKWLADRHTTLLEQAALASFLNEGHLERHIRRMRRIYKRRRDVLLEALDRHFGGSAIVRGDAAGMHMTVRFADDRVARNAERHGVHIASTARYYLGAAPAHEYVLAFSGVSERGIREGVKRLAG